jgi:hypothetical protein
MVPDYIVLASGGQALVEVGWTRERLSVHAWDLNRRAQVQMTTGLGEIATIAFSPTHRTMALLGREATAFWDLVTLRPIGRPAAPGEGSVEGLRFGSDAALVVRRHDGSTTLWRVAPPQPSAELLREGDVATAAAFSPDGLRLALASLARRRTLLFPPVAVSATQEAALAFHPRRPLLISADQGSPPILWNLNTRSWIRRACEIANRNLTLEEWRQYMGREVPYQKTCPNLPGPLRESASEGSEASRRAGPQVVDKESFLARVRTWPR